MIGLKHFDVTVTLVNTYFLIGQTFTGKDPLFSDQIPKLSLGRDKIENMECWGGITWGMSNKMEKERKKEREGRGEFWTKMLWLWLFFALQTAGWVYGVWNAS